MEEGAGDSIQGVGEGVILIDPQGYFLFQII